LVERDARAAPDLELYIVARGGRAAELVAAFAGCNHFEAWQILIDEGMKPWPAMAWLQRWGYWPIGAARETSAVGAILCQKCRREVDAREPCYFDVRGNERRFWHGKCRI